MKLETHRGSPLPAKGSDHLIFHQTLSRRSGTNLLVRGLTPSDLTNED
jgi:hypothetical protein